MAFRMFMGVTAPVPWVPAYAGTTVRGEGVLVGDDGCGGFRARPLGTGPVSGYGVTFLRRHDGGRVWVWGMMVAAPCPLGTGSGAGMTGK